MAKRVIELLSNFVSDDQICSTFVDIVETRV
jgi:hypothetical protein